MLSNLSKSKPHFLVIVSPASGKKKGFEIWRDEVCGYLEAADAVYDELITTHRNHAKEFVSNMSRSLSHYSAVILVGGDGIVYEYIQGLFSREDLYSNNLLDIPLVTVPTGSGNALALNTGNIDVSTAIYAILRGENLKLDITKFERNDKDSNSANIYSLLSFSWGLFADLDVGTDAYRWMGDTRFVYGTLKEIMAQKTVLAKVHILPVIENQKIDILKSDIDIRSSDTSVFEKDSEGKLVFDENKGWKVIEGDFLLLVICNVRYLSADCLMAPSVRLDDGQLEFVYIVNETPSKTKLLEVMSKLKDGTHLSSTSSTSSFLKSVKIRAFYIEPLTKSSTMVVDGEPIPFGPVQAEQFRSVVTVKSQPISQII
eukprot:c18803_g1_i1.p1 GENE.c18803_g1_i1~~c18803_g1_i1.p1  ORF type:complete len:372 (+),score=135.82 c18803_g1_i1:334-1449(+)